MTTNTSQVAHQAADMIEACGLSCGDFGGPHGEVCVTAALRLAAHPQLAPADLDGIPAEEDLAAWLKARSMVEPDQYATASDLVSTWSDHIADNSPTPGENVCLALRDFAADMADLERKKETA